GSRRQGPPGSPRGGGVPAPVSTCRQRARPAGRITATHLHNGRMRELNVATTTHGRVLVDGETDGGPLRLLAGFHGYSQNADEMMEMLRGIPLDGSWTRVSIQGLHRFYRWRAQTTVASWMTR